MRSLVLALGLLLVAVGAYFAARETSVFAIEQIEIVGAPPPVAARVRAALEPLSGTSLVAFSPARADRLLAEVADVASATYDRDFPHALRVVVRAEKPEILVRHRRDAWLLSARGRVLAAFHGPPFPDVPRLWNATEVDVPVGATVDDALAAVVGVMATARREGFRARVRSVRIGPDELTFVLPSGTELLLGDRSRLPLKLAVARRILPLANGAAYVDVSVPERAVAGSEPIRDSQP